MLVGGLPTGPTTKKPQLGTIDRVRENVRDLWCLRMMLSASQLEVQPGGND